MRSEAIFDRVTRSLGSGMPRRHIFKLAFGGLVATALAELGIPKRSMAQSCFCQGQPYDPTTACCTTAGIQQKAVHPVRDLGACPNKVNNPNYTDGSNGCGTDGFPLPDHFGKANWLSCCDGHDLCWGKCNTDGLHGQAMCNNTFGNCLSTVCHSAFDKDPHPLKLQMCLAV